jgi:hypothetical protein
MARKYVLPLNAGEKASLTVSKADGRLLYVYIKEVPSAAPVDRRPVSRVVQSSFDDMDVDTNGNTRPGSFYDGRFGFSESGQREPPRGPRRRY